MAALTITSIADAHPQIPQVAVGGLRGRLVVLTFDDGTDAGGAALSAADLGMSQILFVDCHVDAGDNGAVVGGGHLVQYNYVTGALQFFEEEGAAAGGPLLEVNHSLEDVQVRALVLGF